MAKTLSLTCIYILVQFHYECDQYLKLEPNHIVELLPSSTNLILGLLTDSPNQFKVYVKYVLKTRLFSCIGVMHIFLVQVICSKNLALKSIPIIFLYTKRDWQQLLYMLCWLSPCTDFPTLETPRVSYTKP